MILGCQRESEFDTGTGIFVILGDITPKGLRGVGSKDAIGIVTARYHRTRKGLFSVDGSSTHFGVRVIKTRKNIKFRGCPSYVDCKANLRPQ